MVEVASDLLSEIRNPALSARFGDGQAYRCLPVKTVHTLAAAFGTGVRQVELAALEADIVPQRYARNLRTFSPAQQKTLLASSIGVVGLGGLGGTVAEILARIGIGSLTLIDGDTFEDSNLNRQRFSFTDAIAKPKTEIARREINRINPAVELHVQPEFLDEENGSRLLSAVDAVVDCLDSLPTRFLLQRIAKASGIPLVSAAVAGLSGHLTVIFPEDIGLSLIYGDEKNVPRKGVESSLGTLSPCVSTMAALEASEVVKILLKQPSGLRNRLLTVDLQDNLFDLMQLV